MIRYTIVSCSLGRLLLVATPRGVCQVRFGDAERELEAAVGEEFPFATPERDDPGLRHWSGPLVRYVDGEAAELDLPLDVRGSRFQRRVWDALQAIPRGHTRTYSDVARAIGAPRAARAVARACATNPVAVLIPCHRVVARSGGLGGYSYGVARKEELLEREAPPAAGGALQSRSAA